jgi:hypothetical protein
MFADILHIHNFQALVQGIPGAISFGAVATE